MFLQKFKFLPAILFFISSATLAQKVENLSFEQAGKQIIIYYDLTGAQTGQSYDVQVFCSTDGGKTLGTALKQVTGDAGTGISGGFSKKIVWDVLSEIEKLTGDILFEIRIKNSGTGTVTDVDKNVYKTVIIGTHAGTVTDVDGNVYKTVTIGTQTWMAENLKTTKYRNGDLIGTTFPRAFIYRKSTPKYQWAYDGNMSNVATYGRLYTWYAVTDSRNVCPTGWHVPTDAEWTKLTINLGDETVTGGKLKETGTTHWLSPNTGAKNETGFTALPGGYRNDNGKYYNMGSNGHWWSSTEYSTNYAYHRNMSRDFSDVGRGSDSMYYGFSVRCLRD